MPSLSHKRGTRAQINAAAGAGALKLGELYLMTDEARLTVGTASGAHQPMAKQGEGGGNDAWTWVLLGTDVANSTIAYTNVTGLTFPASANSTYIVDLVGTFQAVAVTTGIAVALDIPSGNVSGQFSHLIAATLIGGDQNADGTALAVSAGVRNANTNTSLSARFIVAIGASGGPVQLQFRSEVAGSAVTMKSGITAMGWRPV